MDELVELIETSHSIWVPQVVEAILGTNDPASVAEALTQGVAAALAVPVSGARFYEPGVGIVAGLELADGRAVVAKLHRGTVAPPERLAAIARVQATLVEAGFAGAGAAGRSVGARGRLADHRGASRRRPSRWVRLCRPLWHGDRPA